MNLKLNEMTYNMQKSAIDKLAGAIREQNLNILLLTLSSLCCYTLYLFIFGLFHSIKLFRFASDFFAFLPTADLYQTNV